MLLGTVVIIVVSMLLIEVFNLSIYGIQVNKLSRTAAYQAAAMFTQETYNTSKGDTTTDKRNFVGTLDDITVNGADKIYCSANFFNSNKVSYLNITDLNDPNAGDKIYEALFYNPNSEFQKFIKNGLRDHSSQIYPYTNLKLLGLGALNNGDKVFVNKLNFLSDDTSIQMNQDRTQINTYIENKYTPANLGIPFIDKNVATNMFQYSLTKLLSGCDPDNIWSTSDSVIKKTTSKSYTRAEDGTLVITRDDTKDGMRLPSVYYHGFRCYVSSSIQYKNLGNITIPDSACARITDIEYKTYDLTKANKSSTSDNKLPGRKEFKADTGYIVRDEDTTFSKSKAPDIVSMSKNGTTGIGWSSSTRKSYNISTPSKVGIGTLKFGDENLDNALVTVATIKYTVPMKYVGITPLAQVFNFVMGKQVAGIGSGGSTETDQKTEYNYRDSDNNLDLAQSGNLYGGSEFTGDGELSAYYKSDEVQFMLIN